MSGPRPAWYRHSQPAADTNDASEGISHESRSHGPVAIPRSRERIHAERIHQCEQRNRLAGAPQLLGDFEAERSSRRICHEVIWTPRLSLPNCINVHRNPVAETQRGISLAPIERI